MRDELKKLRKIYENGGNILSYIKENTGNIGNSAEAIAISYDLQAGSYIKFSENNPEYENERARVYSDIINSLGNNNSIVEVGIGEGTTFANVIPRLNSHYSARAGFDISFSRVKLCQNYLSKKNIDNGFIFMANLFHSPIKSSSIDIVYTNHALEPNGLNEIAALKELYRITKKYLVLFEPYFDTKKGIVNNHINKHGYVKNLYAIAKELGYKVIDCRELFTSNPTSANNTGLILIEKKCPGCNEHADSDIALVCPITGESLEMVKGNLYSRESMLLYPVVDGVACLLPDNAIIATRYLDGI